MNKTYIHPLEADELAQAFIDMYSRTGKIHMNT